MKQLNLNYTFKNDETALEWVDTLYTKYDMPHGYKSQLEHLAVSGVEDFRADQLTVVKNILRLEGFTAYNIA